MKKNSFIFFLLLFLFIILGLKFSVFSENFSEENFTGCCLPSPNATGDFEKGIQKPIFVGKAINYDFSNLLSLNSFYPFEEEKVLGTENVEKWIEVDLSEQTLYAWEGDKLVYKFLISSGKWAPTPVGEFRIWVKLRYTKMEGGIKGTRTYYYLPNVPYTQYFYKSYGLHGTYWHNNFGQPMSHGCVNLSIPDAEKLFYWTSPALPKNKNIVYSSKENPGTRVVIHE
ncbi:MAG: L,D-transpeptidase [Microgenomates group bacterium]